nr:uncharacterized protein LOC120963156 [Aegilops tauschii subsp. strangulata]
MLYFQLKVPHLTTNQGPHGLQPAFGGAAIVYLVELHPTTPGGGDCNPGAAYNGEEDSNQLHPSTAELQSCTSELQPAFGGATRLDVESCIWQDLEQRRDGEGARRLLLSSSGEKRGAASHDDGGGRGGVGRARCNGHGGAAGEAGFRQLRGWGQRCNGFRRSGPHPLLFFFFFLSCANARVGDQTLLI